MNATGAIVRRAVVEEILGLRWGVLFAGTNRPSADYVEDGDPATLHAGAFDGDRAVGCASFLPSQWEGRPAWHLRGMATDPAYRNQGIGSRVLQFAEEELRRTSDIRQLWCNARLRAVPFYERHGWRVVGEAFEIEGVGPHRRMVKTLS